MNVPTLRPRFALALAVLLLAGCLPAKPQVKKKAGPSAAQVSDTRGRSDAAFSDLNAVETGQPVQAADLEKEKPAPPPPPVVPEKPYKEKEVKGVAVNNSKTAPDWTRSQPSMSGYYVGIGVATGRGNEEEDWSRARNGAYTELASSLKVHITSIVKDYFKEKSMKLYNKDNVAKDATTTESSYSQDTSFFVDQTLEGVEIADRWKDDGQKKYWMLVRLSKAEIERRIRERLEKARKKALDYVMSAMQSEREAKLGEAFKGYFHAYLSLREYFGGVVEADLNGDKKPEVINHEIERAVFRLAGDLKWQVDNPNLKAVVGSGLPNPLTVKVIYSGKPVLGLPVAFGFQRGKGSVEKQVTTIDGGIASARLMKVFGEKQAIIGAKVDMGALIADRNELNIVAAKFGKDMENNTGKFFVALEELSAHIDIREENLGSEVSNGTVAADVKERLHAELGLVFTKELQGADLEIKGEAITASCTDFYEKRMCTARVNVTVTDRTQNRQIFAKKYNINGNGPNDEEAGRDALRKVGPKIASALIEQMQ